MSFRYTCRTCGEIHEGVPALSASAPLFYYAIAPEERAARCELTSDTCVVDDAHFFVRGNIAVAVDGLNDQFHWGVWVSLSRENFSLYIEHFENPERSKFGPFFGWLSAELKSYPSTENLKTMVHLQDIPLRPSIELEPTDHPLAVEQRKGISQERLGEIYSAYLH